MLGHRGCRLGITWPEIYEMQARAIFEAAAETGAEPEVMVPLVAAGSELARIKEVIDRTAAMVAEETGRTLAYSTGTMIELPRAALRAAEIAAAAEFFSFGHQRPDADRLRHFPRMTPAPSSAPIATAASWRATRSRTLDIEGVGELGAPRRRARPGRAAGPQARHLRRAWRRPGLGRLLPRNRPRLRLLLPLPRPHSPPRRRPGGVGCGGKAKSGRRDRRRPGKLPEFTDLWMQDPELRWRGPLFPAPCAA